VTAAQAVRAALLDFNGTLSDDEPLLCDLFSSIFSEYLGVVLDVDEYYRSLAGLSDAEIVETILEMHDRGGDTELASFLQQEKTRRYCREVLKRPRIRPGAVHLVREVARLVPVGVVTGAVHAEVDAAIEAAGLARDVRVVVAGDDVARGKPDPEGYEIALEALRALAPREVFATLDACEVVVFEDSIAGARAANAAGMPCVGVVGTADPALLASEATRIVNRLDEEVVEWLIPMLATGPGRNIDVGEGGSYG
jgi:beta-phosphoglucomutase